MAEVLRVGCIGCGQRAELYVEKIARQESPLLRMHGYADVRQANAERLLAEYGGRYATADPEQVLADPEVDAVLISTWHDTHTAYAVTAARHGKHILIEKPLALTIDECWQIEEAVRRAGVTVAVGLKMRFMPLVRRIRQWVPEPFLLPGQMMNDRVPDDSWSLQPGIGGGTVLGAGCHTADLLCYLAGADPVEVYACGSDRIHQMAGQIDNLVGTIKFANCAVAALVHGDPGRNPYTSTFFCQVFGLNQGACLYDRYHRAHLWGCAQPTLGIADLDEFERADVEGDLALLRHFALCAVARRPCEVGVREGRIATTLMVKMLESAARGLPMQVEASWRSHYG
ncbi:MAG: Gfo/Idh/MocA family protein [Caldilinea sp.]